MLQWCAGQRIEKAAAVGQKGKSTLDSYVVDGQRAGEALRELAMFIFTSNTPPARANNPHLQRAMAILGAEAPTPHQLRHKYLPEAKARVQAAVNDELEGQGVAIASDGWSKRTAVRGAPMINATVLPENGAVPFHTRRHSCIR